jgi:hypothetical protein
MIATSRSPMQVAPTIAACTPQPKTEPRTSADVGAELEQRRTRRAALEDRLSHARAELDRLRTARARSLVEGTKGPTPQEIATLAEESDSIAAALELLAGDVANLEAEGKATARVEAEQAANEAINVALKSFAELDTLFRRVARETILPATRDIERGTPRVRPERRVRGTQRYVEPRVQHDPARRTNGAARSARPDSHLRVIGGRVGMNGRASRLDRLESVVTRRREATAHANRAHLARYFATHGDPRDAEDFGDFSTDEETALVWHFDAWRIDPAGFIDGYLPDECRPTATQLEALERTMWRDVA